MTMRISPSLDPRMLSGE